MARIDDLLARIGDTALQLEIKRSIADMTRHRQFGLVFEQHIPETTLLRLPIKRDQLVQIRSDSEGAVFRVAEVNSKTARVVPLAGGEAQKVSIADLLVIRRFGEPIYPTLEHLGGVRRSTDRPSHIVINGENYHALQLLEYLHAGQVDCIYIDPPYNTGARDWKYNNAFVDKNDRWRHSKWISMMERRLRIAKRLLAKDGVLICTIDKNEHAHLVMLLEQTFRGWDITSVSIVHNPRGVQGDNFSYTHEYAVFVIPPGVKALAARPLDPDEKKSNTSNLRNWGTESERTDAKNCFYPILVKGDTVIGFGAVPEESFHPKGANRKLKGGIVEVWPIDEKGVERKWRYARQTVETIRHQLVVQTARNKDVAIHLAKETGKYRTVWTDKLFDASTHGSQLVRQFTNVEFPYPKSLYAVYEALFAVTAHKPDALILDFFAGSGTTLHATMLLNSADGGNRRCLLVTNNEVEEREAKALMKRGFYPGDPEFEKLGVFESITRPRITAAISGKTAKGKRIDGRYRRGDEREMADGFEESVEYFRLAYLEPDDLVVRQQFSAVHPLLWIRAGALGKLPGPTGSNGSQVIRPESGYAVLKRSSQFPAFLEQLNAAPEIKHVFLVCDGEEEFNYMREFIDGRVTTMLYRDYLRTFRINLGTTR